MRPRFCPFCGDQCVDHSEDYSYFDEEVGCTVVFEEYTCHSCGLTFTV